MHKNISQVLVLHFDLSLQREFAQHLTQTSFEPLFADRYALALNILQESNIDALLCQVNTLDDACFAFLDTLRASHTVLPVYILVDTIDIHQMTRLMRLHVKDCFLRTDFSWARFFDLMQKHIAQYRREYSNYQLELEKANHELKRSLGQIEIDMQAGLYVQRKMLPETPKVIGGFEFSHHLVPSTYLSGDFVEYQAIGDRYVLFLIADISGHGSSSAFITVLLKNIAARLRSAWKHKGENTILSPAKFLNRVNEEFIDLQSGKHATMFVGVLDLKEKLLCYSVAGHHPLPILSVADGTAFIEAKGRPVGLFPDYDVEEHRLLLADDFTLMIFSDGILEILPQEKLAEKEQYILQTSRSVYESKSKNTLELIVDSFGIKQTGHLPDDIAVLVLQHRSDAKRQ